MYWCDVSITMLSHYKLHAESGRISDYDDESSYIGPTSLIWGGVLEPKHEGVYKRIVCRTARGRVLTAWFTIFVDRLGAFWRAHHFLGMPDIVRGGCIQGDGLILQLPPLNDLLYRTNGHRISTMPIGHSRPPESKFFRMDDSVVRIVWSQTFALDGAILFTHTHTQDECFFSSKLDT